MDFKKGQLITLNDSGRIKSATVVKDGIDTQGRVRVRPEGFPMDMSITTEINDRVYVITN
tara:strand:+ start:1011 stop:1190 length:180 start_codon:yes stop_codon:yes gene_type:complete